MAKRPVFLTNNTVPHYLEASINFVYCSGFADSQRKKSMQNLHSAFKNNYPAVEILEVSRFSDNILGQKLSAFNLLTKLDDGRKVPVENAFQSSKVFEKGGPFRDLLYIHPAAAKKAECLLNSGNLTGFNYQGEEFPLDPKTFFYDWLYINALYGDEKTTAQLLKYDAFTDIAFNPEKSINCQARTIAIYVSLYRKGAIDIALKSPTEFKEIVYGVKEHYEQTSLFT